VSIDRLTGVTRRRIAILSPNPPPKLMNQLRIRNFETAICTDGQLNNPYFLEVTAAVVFIQSKDKPLQIDHDLCEYATTLLDFDCRIFVLSESTSINILINVIDKLKLPTAGLLNIMPQEKSKPKEIVYGDPPTPHVRVMGDLGNGNSWETAADIIANFVCEHAPGRAPDRSLQIEKTGDEEISISQDILIRRAFFDCRKVVLKELTDGNSGVLAYIARVELANGAYSKWPQPYFVKLGDREKIYAEYKSYIDKVDPYIPYHLTPNLVPERCCLGAKMGIIVGDYIAGSESLLDCARGGRSAQVISCLFDQALWNWHNDEARTLRPIMDVVRLPKSINQSRIDQARSWGAGNNLKQLKNVFLQISKENCLVGPIHGDLHAANVRVRAPDAILIDFCAHKNGAIIYDPACLEASLLIDGGEISKIGIIDWLKMIDTLYSSTPLLQPSCSCHPANPLSWLYSCIEQIRLYARKWEISPNQYAMVLSAALLCKASKVNRKKEDPQEPFRAAAYFIADRILSNIAKSLKLDLGNEACAIIKY